jgi:methyl-accepting chemotaxis protein
MTVEERFERIEHITAGLVEERRKDREEYRQLWRDTQRQINELTLKVSDINDAVTRLSDRIDHLAEESRLANQRLADRIDSLGSAMGQFLAALPKPRNTE